jgi:putative FmdB family regulatory protein
MIDRLFENVRRFPAWRPACIDGCPGSMNFHSCPQETRSKKRSRIVPVYEFYCEPCNTLFSFYSKTIRSSEDSPLCPRCGGGLHKRVSSFSVVERSKGVQSLENLPFNQQRLADGMQKFRAEHERLRDENPARAEGMMKNFSRWLGGAHLEEDKKRAMQRVLDSDDPLAQKIDVLESLTRADDEPVCDEHLYEY